jgi:NADH:ubiquinone oxidoreductase subunit C
MQSFYSKYTLIKFSLFFSFYFFCYFKKSFNYLNQSFRLLKHPFNLTICALNQKNISNYLFILKNHLFFNFLQFIDLTAIDYLYLKKRFKIVYILKNPYLNRYIFLTTFVSNYEMLFSSFLIFKGSNWSEREVWDLFGIFFFNHPDLRRILTDYGFRGYPLRKEFPLTGFKEIFYNEYLQLLKYKLVSLTQEFRYFHKNNPWFKTLL